MQSLVIILIALAAVIAIVLLLRGRRQRVVLGEQPTALAEPERRTFAPTPKEARPAPVSPRPEPEVLAAQAGTPIPATATAAPVSFSPAPAPAEGGDALTMLKGLGPKAAAQLNALGILRFADLAGLDEAGVDTLDAQMGNFKGRIRRDQWVEQARLLAEGDRAGFEAKYGRIG